MSEQPVVDTAAAPYKESDDFVPDPTAVFGTLETSGTAGGDNERAEKVTPIFEAAKANDLAYAKRAVDPDDTDVDEATSVVLPDNGRDVDSAREAVRKAASAYEKEPVPVEDPSLLDSQKEAEKMENTDPVRRAAEVEGQQQQAAPAGGTGKGSDDATQRLEKQGQEQSQGQNQGQGQAQSTQEPKAQGDAKKQGDSNKK